jgi:hypothetical protein
MKYWILTGTLILGFVCALTLPRTAPASPPVTQAGASAPIRTAPVEHVGKPQAPRLAFKDTPRQESKPTAPRTAVKGSTCCSSEAEGPKPSAPAASLKNPLR